MNYWPGFAFCAAYGMTFLIVALFTASRQVRTCAAVMAASAFIGAALSIPVTVLLW